jgi:MoaA/NifB/PqqE/SkfB family radical SAM enzyme
MTQLTMDITGVCNEKCRFCYQDLDGSVLSEEEIMDLVNDSNADAVEIGGGEPFLDNRIVRIIKEIREKGKRVHVSTNATLIPEGLLDLEQKAKDGIQLQASIHASNPALYEQITGRNLFDKVAKNVGTLRPHFSMLMTSAIYQDNLSDVPKLVDLAKELDLPLRVNLVFPVGGGKNVNLLTPQQVDQLRGYLLQQRVIKGDRINSPLIHVNNCQALANAYGLERRGICPYDFGKAYVSPKGEKSRCEFYGSASLTVKGKPITERGQYE